MMRLDKAIAKKETLQARNKAMLAKTQLVKFQKCYGTREVMKRGVMEKELDKGLERELYRVQQEIARKWLVLVVQVKVATVVRQIMS